MYLLVPLIGITTTATKFNVYHLHKLLYSSYHLHLYTGMSDATLKTTLISVTCVLALLMFIIGFICGHYLQIRRKLAHEYDEKSSSPTVEQVENLELKENVAYITLRQK